MDSLTKGIVLAPLNLLYKISPKAELKLLFYLKQRYKLDLINPTTFNQKLQWIKLYDKNPLMPKCCDKYTVREFVKQQGCEESLNELYWHGFNVEDIPFENLPQKFAIKVTHGSTFNIICEDKSKLDINNTKILLNKWLKAKFLPCYGEWFYGIERPRIIVEQFLEDYNKAELRDYKIFCFNGEPKLVDVHSGRFGEHRRNIYDLDWNFKDGINFKYDNDDIIEKPAQLPLVLEYAKKLSAPFLHARVDFFIVKDKVYFGEITFTNGAGFDHITPRSFDELMGSWLELPKNVK